MKILFDILHPAHVHFFRNAITVLEEEGHEVIVTARDKDLTLELLELYGIDYTCISREAQSKAGMARELLSRNWRLLQLVRKSEPDVMASIGGISTAQVGFLTRTRNLIFYDTENATVSNLLSYPFASEVITPDCYRGRVLGKHVTYSGYHELAYLHPKRFTPDPTVLENHGIDPKQPYSVVRFVSWKALHDVQAEGFSLDQKKELVHTLLKHGRVFITSESPLPSDMELHRLTLPPDKVHHLLAFAQLFIGESATMASESVVLGTPAIYVDKVGRGYTDEQETRYGLCVNFTPSQSGEAISRADEILQSQVKTTPSFRQSVDRLHREKRDGTLVQLEALVRKDGETDGHLPASAPPTATSDTGPTG